MTQQKYLQAVYIQNITLKISQFRSITHKVVKHTNAQKEFSYIQDSKAITKAGLLFVIPRNQVNVNS